MYFADFLGHAFRPDGVPLEEHHVTAYPEMCVGTLPLPLYQEEVVPPEASEQLSRVLLKP